MHLYKKVRHCFLRLLSFLMSVSSFMGTSNQNKICPCTNTRARIIERRPSLTETLKTSKNVPRNTPSLRLVAPTWKVLNHPRSRQCPLHTFCFFFQLKFKLTQTLIGQYPSSSKTAHISNLGLALHVSMGIDQSEFRKIFSFCFGANNYRFFKIRLILF